MKIYAHALKYRLIHHLCLIIYYGYSCILVVCLTKECKGTVSVIYIYLYLYYIVVANARTAKIIILHTVLSGLTIRSTNQCVN